MSKFVKKTSPHQVRDGQSQQADKLQKLLAHTGFGSRREIEKWIDNGRLSINGKRAKLGDRATYRDKIVLDGKHLTLIKSNTQKIKALIYHKPEGVICSRKDPAGRPSVFDALPSIVQGRWVSIGRLDLNTSGLLLFTNQGELANQLMHPSTGVEREYLVRIRGIATENEIHQLTKQGINIDGKPAHFESVVMHDSQQQGSNHWYRVVIKEGKYREVRRMWESLGHPVSRLKRIRYGSVKLTRDIKLGQAVKMAPKQLEKLVSSTGLHEQFADQLYSSDQPQSKQKIKSRKKTHSYK